MDQPAETIPPTSDGSSDDEVITDVDAGILSRAQGCLMGQLAGDALGSLVEFQTPDWIQHCYPKGVRQLSDGGTWNTIAGQLTDNSEMALLLARMLANRRTYDADSALSVYQYWLSTDPSHCGGTIYAGLRGNPKMDSQANGALMRISPLGIFGTNVDAEQLVDWAMQDAELTHPNYVCLMANALYASAIAYAIRAAAAATEIYQSILEWAEEMCVGRELMAAIDASAYKPPRDYVDQQGWVIIAFHNAFYQLLHAPNLEEGVIDTVMQGGGTDTNAAICGALLGAVYGKGAILAQWLESLLACRPRLGDPRVRHPRPECFWPVDALELAECLLTVHPQRCAQLARSVQSA